MKLTTKDIKEFEIDLTGTCNLSCPLCTRNYEHAQHLISKNIRPVKEIIKELEFFPNLNRIMVAGAISEPCLYLELFELFEYFNSRNIQIDMFTNGSLKDSEYWEKLGKIFEEGNVLSSCTFTICGSTQEIHEKYRINSNLSKLLNNAQSFRKNSNKDILQIIEFKYNAHDIHNMEKIAQLFSNSYIVGTEGRRRLTKKVKECDEDISPLIKRENAINTIFRTRKKPSINNNVKIECKAFNAGKMHMNQYGQLHYCYISMEFPESKDDFLLDDPNKLHDDYIFDYDKVHAFTYPDCFLCEKNTKRLIEISGLDFVC